MARRHKKQKEKFNQDKIPEESPENTSYEPYTMETLFPTFYRQLPIIINYFFIFGTPFDMMINYGIGVKGLDVLIFMLSLGRIFFLQWQNDLVKYVSVCITLFFMPLRVLYIYTLPIVIVIGWLSTIKTRDPYGETRIAAALYLGFGLMIVFEYTVGYDYNTISLLHLSLMTYFMPKGVILCVALFAVVFDHEKSKQIGDKNLLLWKEIEATISEIIRRIHDEIPTDVYCIFIPLMVLHIYLLNNSY